jgi:hypothetical protein
MTVVGRGEEKSLNSSNSSKKDSREVEKEREEAKRRILEENRNICKEFMLSLPFEKKIPKVIELETIQLTMQKRS